MLMKSKYGNVYKNVKSDAKKKELENLGYSVVEEVTQGVSINKMKKEDLIKYAEENGITITATQKADILKEIEDYLAVNDQELE